MMGGFDVKHGATVAPACGSALALGWQSRQTIVAGRRPQRVAVGGRSEEDPA
jgi:hypothetical protein